MSLSISVIVTTFDQPEWLERCLWGFALQTRAGFELLVADDGSDERTAAAIERVRGASGLRIVHVRHEHRGFRKTEILNRAIVASQGSYLVFTDGDCVPRPDFVEVHERLAVPGRYLSGGCLRLPAEVSARVTVEAIRAGAPFHVSWLAAQGWRPGKHALRLLPRRPARLLDALTTTRATWNGHNASTWRECILAVNGFDGDMGYGGLDRALGERLENLGVFGRQVRYRAPVLHLHHERGYVDPAVLRRNRAIRDEIRREGRVRARQGIAELPRATAADPLATRDR